MSLMDGESPPVVVSALYVVGGPEPQEGGGLGQAQTIVV